MDVELLALEFALKGCEYYMLYAKDIRVWGDCRAIEGMLNKHIADIKNPKHARIMEKSQRFDLVFTHVTGTQNKIADCLSRMARYTFSDPEMNMEEPRILKMSK